MTDERKESILVFLFFSIATVAICMIERLAQ
jgi:hypothetical protein